MVTPTNDYEEKVSMKFVRQVQSILNKKKNKFVIFYTKLKTSFNRCVFFKFV